MNGYEKGSEILMSAQVLNSEVLETSLKKIFKQKFKQRKDIGTETFEGDVNEMISIIMDEIAAERASRTAAERASRTAVQIKNIGDIKKVETCLLEDITTEIKDCIVTNNELQENQNIDDSNEEKQEEIKYMMLYNKAYDMLISLLNNKNDLQALTSLSHTDALLSVNDKMISCSSDDPEKIKMINHINCVKYVLYNLVKYNFEDLKQVAFS